MKHKKTEKPNRINILVDEETRRRLDTALIRYGQGMVTKIGERGIKIVLDRIEKGGIQTLFDEPINQVKS
jgi:hypothetical protein